MSLEDVMAEAFTRGTGISREQALKKRRVTELRERFPKAPVKSNLSYAEIAYLGERLQKAAFKNLPANLQRKAKSWPSMNSQQQYEVLYGLLDQLNSSVWALSRGLRRHQKGYGRPDSVLPLQRGSFTRGPVQPNCLGMSQILMGFAAETGARFMMVNVLGRQDEGYSQQAIEVLGLIERCLDAREDVSTARHGRAVVRRNRRRSAWALNYAQHTRQAHHALAIRLKNRRWYLVDPYLTDKDCRAPMHTIGHERDLSVSYARLQKYPERLTWLGHSTGFVEMFDRVFIAPFTALLETKTPSVETLIAFNLLIETALHDLGATDLPELWRHFELLSWFGVTKKAAHAVYELSEEERQVRRTQAIERARHSKQFCQKVFGWLIYCYVEFMLEALHLMLTTLMLPTLMEFVDPAYGLGLATMHHLASQRGAMSSEELIFNDQQFITRDVITHLTSEERLAAKKLVDDHLKALGKLPPSLVLYENRLLIKQHMEGTAANGKAQSAHP